MENRRGGESGGQEPSVSVVLVAGIQFLVSAAALIFWGLNLWGLVVSYRRYPVNHERFEPEFWIFYIAAPVGFALLGLVTSIGLLRLREWARRRTIFLSVVPVSTYALLLIVRPASLFPPETGHGGLYAVGDIYLDIVAALVAILAPVSIWWLVLFTRPNIKAQFQATSTRFKNPTRNESP
jgi:hypothetical protein